MNIDKVMRREQGQGLVEYALILILVAAVVIVVLAIAGPSIGNIFSNVVDMVNRVQGDPAVQTGCNPTGSTLYTYTFVNNSGSNLKLIELQAPDCKERNGGNIAKDGGSTTAQGYEGSRWILRQGSTDVSTITGGAGNQTYTYP